MSTDNENDVADNENNPVTGVATASSQGNLDSAMAALIRAARPADRPVSTNPFDAVRAARAEAAAAAESNAGQAQAPQQPSQSPFAALASAAAPTASQEYTNPFAAAAAAFAAPAAEPAVQPEPTPVAPEPEPEPTPSAVAVAEPPPAPAPAPEPTYAAPAPESSHMTQQAVASISIMEDSQAAPNQHLVDASKYIADWLSENIDNDEVINAALDWARKNATAEHNGQVIASLLQVEDIDPELTLITVRWITKYSNHPLAPEIVAGLTAQRE